MTDRQTDRQTDARGKTICLPTLSGGDIKKVYPCKPQFFHIKVGFKGVFIAWTCFPDGKQMLFLIKSKLDQAVFILGLNAQNNSSITPMT